MTKLLAALLALALSFAIAACGGDDDDDDSGGGETTAQTEPANLGPDEQAISDVITETVTTSDPAHCTELQTEKFTDQTQAEAGAAAIEACEEDAEDPGDDADSVEVTNIDVAGGRATAEAAITGSALNGQTLALGLIKEGDQWKLDELIEFVVFDRDSLVAAFDEEFSSDEEIPGEVTDCLREQLEAAGDDELQDLFLNQSEESLAQFFGDCFSG